MNAERRRKMSRPWRPEVDALVWLEPVLLLIEAKVAKYVDGLAKLPMYRILIATTPELVEWKDWEVRMRLVVPRSQAWVEEIAKGMGIEIDPYEPEWLSDYYEYRDLYWTREYQERRLAILEARKRLGLR